MANPADPDKLLLIVKQFGLYGNISDLNLFRNEVPGLSEKGVSMPRVHPSNLGTRTVSNITASCFSASQSMTTPEICMNMRPLGSKYPNMKYIP